MEPGPFIRARKTTAPGKALDVVCFTVGAQGGVHASTIKFAEKVSTDSLPDQISLSKEAAQALIDDLWDAGIRPSRKPEPLALLAAKDQHISHLFELSKLALTAK